MLPCYCFYSMCSVTTTTIAIIVKYIGVYSTYYLDMSFHRLKRSGYL
jgi:hypothetical protein